jgi:hypothetical protein
VGTSFSSFVSSFHSLPITVDISVILSPGVFTIISGLLLFVNSMKAVNGFLGAFGSLSAFFLPPLEPFPVFSFPDFSLLEFFSTLALDFFGAGELISSLLPR